MMKSSYQIKIDKALIENDYEQALLIAFDGYRNIKKNNRDDVKLYLKLISGFTKILLGKCLKSEGIKKHNGCDFCDVELLDTELIKGHSGAICKSCIELILKNVVN